MSARSGPPGGSAQGAWFGTRLDRLEALQMSGLAGAVTAGVLGILALEGSSATWLEGWATLTCLASFLLARTQNPWAMPVGILAVLLAGRVLLDLGLVGQGWLQYLYYVPVQLVGWWAWVRGGEARVGLPVTRLTWRGWALSLASGLALWWAGVEIFGRLYRAPQLLLWDSSIVASSIVAQTLLTWKKRESWLLWTFPVNGSAAWLFWCTGSLAFAALHLVAALLSAWGWLEWGEGVPGPRPPRVQRTGVVVYKAAMKDR